MKGAEQQEPAYVVHRRAWRETSLMVDVFTLNHGRMTLIARGANSAKSPLKAQLQPFQPLMLDWTGRGDLKTLTQVDVRPGPARGDAQRRREARIIDVPEGQVEMGRAGRQS